MLQAGIPQGSMCTSAKGSAHNCNNILGAEGQGYEQRLDTLKFTTPDRVVLVAHATVGLRSRAARWKLQCITLEQGSCDQQSKQLLESAKAHCRWGKDSWTCSKQSWLDKA